MTFESMETIKGLLEDAIEENKIEYNFYRQNVYELKKQIDEKMDEKFPAQDGMMFYERTWAEQREFEESQRKFREEDPEMQNLQNQVEASYSLQCEKDQRLRACSKALTEFLNHQF